MTNEEQITKNLTLFEYYKEQLNSLDMQMQYLQAAVGDTYKAKITMEHLGKSKGVNELLIPIGGGAFFPVTAKDASKVLVDIGAGIVIEKTIADAVKKIDSRIENLQKNQEKLYSIAQQVQTDMTDLSEKTQKMMAESKI